VWTSKIGPICIAYTSVCVPARRAAPLLLRQRPAGQDAMQDDGQVAEDGAHRGTKRVGMDWRRGICGDLRPEKEARLAWRGACQWCDKLFTGDGAWCTLYKHERGCTQKLVTVPVNYPTVGTVVEAKWSTEFGPGKEWYRGKVAKVHAGKTSSRDPSFDVAYDDGELEEKVRWENIRVVDPSTPVRPEPAPWPEDSAEQAEAERHPHKQFLEACVPHGLAKKCGSHFCKKLYSFTGPIMNPAHHQHLQFLDLMCRLDVGRIAPQVDTLTPETVEEFRACRRAVAAAQRLDLKTLDLTNRRKAKILDVCKPSPTETHALMLSISVLSDVCIEEQDSARVQLYIEFALSDAEHRGHMVSSTLEGSSRPSFLESSSESSILRTLPLKLLDRCMRSVFQSRPDGKISNSHFALAVRKALMIRRLVAVGNAFPTHPAPSSEVLEHLARIKNQKAKWKRGRLYYTSCAECGRVYKGYTPPAKRTDR
jgi:hypothetical protein